MNTLAGTPIWLKHSHATQKRKEKIKLVVADSIIWKLRPYEHSNWYTNMAETFTYYPEKKGKDKVSSSR